MSQNLSSSNLYPDTGYRYLRWWPHISALLLVVVELCWILPWFQMVTQITQTAPLWITGAVLGGIMLAAYVLGMFMEMMRLLRNVQLAGLGLLLFGSLVIAENLLLQAPIQSVAGSLTHLDPGAVLVLFFVIWMWWRGVSLSRGSIHPIIAWRRFELGMLFFISYIFIAARIGFIVPDFRVFFLFLFTGLLAVIFARVSYVGIIKGVQKNPFDLRWLLSVVGVLAVTVIFAAVSGGLLSGQYRLLLDSLGEAVKFLIAVAIFILSIPGLLVSYLLVPIMPWIKSLISETQATPAPEYPVENLAPYFNLQEQPPNLPLILQTLCFWGLVLLLLAVILIRLRNSLSKRQLPEIEEPTSLLQDGEARRLLQKALQDGLDNLTARFRPARRAIVAARIRRIYAQLLDLCGELNLPRLQHRTPLEFLPEMGEIFTTQTEELGVITQAYVRIRYGELPESQEEMDRIEAAWQTIQEQGRQLKRSGVEKLRTADVKQVERPGT